MDAPVVERRFCWHLFDYQKVDNFYGAVETAKKTNIGFINLNEENLTLCPRYQTYALLMDAETEFVGTKVIRNTIYMAL